MKEYLNLLPFQWQKELFVKIMNLHKKNPNTEIIVSNLPYRCGKIHFIKILNEAMKNDKL